MLTAINLKLTFGVQLQYTSELRSLHLHFTVKRLWICKKRITALAKLRTLLH